MKIRSFLALAITSLVLVACNQEEATDSLQSNVRSFTATIENSSRSAVSDAGVFAWTDGDAISVYSAFQDTKSFVTYTYSEDDEKFSTTEDTGIPTSYAVYPAGNHTVENGSLKVCLPSSYESNESTNAIMLASIPESSNVLNFTHLGGLMRFVVKGVPENLPDKKIIFTATGKKITGTFGINEDSEIETSESDKSTEQQVSISFTNNGGDLVFYVPLPVGTYNGFTLAVGDAKISSTATNSITRGKLLLMPALKYVSTSTPVLEKDEDYTFSLTEGDNAEVNVGDGEMLIDASALSDLQASAINAVLDVKYTPNTNNATLSISDYSGSTAPTDSKATVKVTVVGNNNVSSLNINTPELTVSLENGTYYSVTSTTATNTLVIKDGVTITNLIINGGNVIIEADATVGTIENKATGNTITAHVNTVDELNAAIAEGYNVILDTDITSSDIITIDKPITLDGNGKKLTSTKTGSEARAINVSGADGVTIKNLTIEASGERAINIIKNATNVTIDNVTATAANYAVNVAKSAPAAKVVINNSILTGLNVVNVASEGANITIDKTTLVCNDQNTAENYAALVLNADAKNAKITVTDVIFDIKGDSKQSSNGAYDEGGVITINGEVVPQKEVARITYPGPCYYSFETLQAAVTFAKSNDKIQLISDVTLTESLEIPEGKTINLDLNGKTIKIDAAGDEVIDFINRGVLNIYGGSIVAADEEASRRCIYNYGTMTIGQEGVQDSGVTFTQTYDRKGAAINNVGIMTIHDATVNAVFYSIWTSGSQAVTTVNGGTFITTNNVNVKDTWAYAVNVLDGAKLVVNGGSFTGNHGVIAVVNGSNAILNKGTFCCTAGYTGNSDWTLYANGEGSTISYNETDCEITNENTAGTSATEEDGVISPIKKE